MVLLRHELLLHRQHLLLLVLVLVLLLLRQRGCAGRWVPCTWRARRLAGNNPTCSPRGRREGRRGAGRGLLRVCRGLALLHQQRLLLLLLRLLLRLLLLRGVARCGVLRRGRRRGLARRARLLVVLDKLLLGLFVQLGPIQAAHALLEDGQRVQRGLVRGLQGQHQGQCV